MKNVLNLFIGLIVGLTYANADTFNITNSSNEVPLELKGPTRALIGKVVIGAENRYKYNDKNYPWASIGKVRFGLNSRWYCTGSLVGRRIVLTNAHCVDKKYPIYFYPSYHNGLYLTNVRSVQATLVQAGTVTSDTSSGTSVSPSGFSFDNDWAILLLNERLGDEFGYFGSHSFENGWLRQPYWGMASYSNAGSLNSNGEYPLYQKGCRIMENRGSLLHDCDSNPGSSGAPIFAKLVGNDFYSIVTLNNAEPKSRLDCPSYTTFSCSNYGVNPSKFITAINNARSRYP